MVDTVMDLNVMVLGSHDVHEWKTAALRAGVEDAYLSIGYLKANEVIMGGAPECFTYDDGDTFVYYQYIRRPIPGTAYFDITSPYGFGGYVLQGDGGGMANFARAFDAHCQQTGIVSEFVRFHPFLGNHHIVNMSPVNVRFHQPLVVVEFYNGPHDFPQGVKKQVAKKERKALNAGVEVLDDRDLVYYREFVRQYYRTMAYLGARSFYFFDTAFFEMLREHLIGRLRLFVTIFKGQMASALLVIHSGDFAYNFLSCSDAVHRNLGVNDVVQIAALKWARQNGKRRFLLGGGFKGEDSLFQFKAKYSSLRTDYWIGRAIRQPDIYDQLCRQAIEDQSSDPDEFCRRGWFPLYRSTGKGTGAKKI